MAGNANLVVLMGNLTRNPEERHTPSGQAVTTLTVAVNRTYTDKNTGNKVEDTTFVDVVVWGRQAENCVKYLSKGRPVYIEGRLSLNRWETPNGEPRSKLEVVARSVQFLGSPGGAPAEKQKFSADAEKDNSVDDVDDAMEAEDKGIDEEIPF